MSNQDQKGFTLIEISIVLLIVTIILGYTLAMFPVQQNLKKYRDVNSKINEIQEYLIAYAQVNGRLPCPDTDTDGLENSIDAFDIATGAAGTDTIIDSCSAYTGRIPSSTIGITGDLDANGNILDPWGQPYWYHVSNVESGVAGIVDLVSPNGIRNVGISNHTSDLFVCDDSEEAGEVDTSCGGATGIPGTASGDSVVDNVSLVIVSTGKDAQTVSSAIQTENNDGDQVYTYTTFSEASGSEYDDIVKWVVPSYLFSKMIEAGQLP